MNSGKHLPNLTNHPPGGWRYRVEATGVTLRGNSMADLAEMVQRHLKANDLREIDQIEEKIEEFICTEKPGYCSNSRPIALKPGPQVSFERIISGTRTLASWIIGGQSVSKEQAIERASICSTCQYNKDLEDCRRCSLRSWLGVIAEGLSKLGKGKEATPYDDKLKACHVCLCSLKVKVWVPRDIIAKYLPKDAEKRLPDHCWYKKEGLNHE